MVQESQPAERSLGRSLLALAPLLPMRHTCRVALGISTMIPEMHEGCLLGM